MEGAAAADESAGGSWRSETSTILPSDPPSFDDLHHDKFGPRRKTAGGVRLAEAAGGAAADSRGSGHPDTRGALQMMMEFEILCCFPFSSVTKRMGIILKDLVTGSIVFFAKGAESSMIPRLGVKGSQWLLEECESFARVGLRTLVVASRELSASEYLRFRSRYDAAKASMVNRDAKCQREMEKLENNLNLLGLTGVDDLLQQNVPATLESLRHAGIRVWMLTGDKVETATCIAVAAGLKSRSHELVVIAAPQHSTAAQVQFALERFSMTAGDSVLVLDGETLAICLLRFPAFFVLTAAQAPAVLCCRCSPTQKAEVVSLIRRVTGQRTCAIGDGGNDVGMIQAADVGIGLVGKEGRQASLAADFSLTEFQHLRRLLLWHGRNAYQRSAKLAQFVLHRGLIIAVIQVIFSAIFFFTPLAIFQGWLQVGYATYYTTAPVFSMVLDQELPESVVFLYPELYKSLRTGRIMSIKTFLGWLWTSIYQGAVVMMGAILLFENSYSNIIAITFTSLILAELLNVASEIHRWHPLMIASEICTVVVYIFSMFILRSYFDVSYIITGVFWGKVSLLTLLSWMPVHIFRLLKLILHPPQYSKLAY
eukprot:GHVT01066236.1.p1 GENE.GHVT01066236.1~~GHVT01066236.1.p1  ORF type:complete len:596 (-),score=120.20 GHVT01066236.1:4209-5996(-)